MKYCKKLRIILAIVFSILFSIGFASCSPSSNTIENSSKETSTASSKQSTEQNNNPNSSNSTSVTQVNGQLKINYIDVGQADSILIQQGNASMLIDAGNNADSQTVKNYISSQGITKLDYVIGTHPHEDHIGGMDYVINSFQIGKIYMPKATSTTKTFQDVVTAIKNKNMQVTVPTPGETFKLGEANCTILGPINSNSDDLNTFSIVVKVTFGDNKFLFTGDAQTSNEQDMINKGYDLSADVLKVGHHGSHTSTSQAFLDKVNPKYVVISCGKGNDYGHPHKEVMERLQTKNIPVYRTDECGTIVCTSDGKNVSFNVNPGDYKYGSSGDSSNNSSSNATITNGTPSTSSSNASVGNSTSIIAPTPVPTPAPSDNQSLTVYITKTGKKYHSAGCRYLSKSQIPISLKDAKSEGYGPCSVCNPPQ